MDDARDTEQTEQTAEWGPRGTAAATFAARLSFQDVSLSFGTVPAVRDVSFELQQGEIVCLLGPSGCGKTTLLRLAAGVELPQRGRVLMDGKEIAGPSVFVPPEKRNVGLMYQDFALFPHLTILENVAFGLRGLKRDLAHAEARNALRRVGLDALEGMYPHALSGGEQQRVALARAIVPRPAVMLMDEPFSGLDQRLRDRVRHETLAVLKETRATSILVTHDPVEAMGMADRILLMRQGRLIQEGTPEQLYREPIDIEAARFFCDFNELSARVSDGIAEFAVGSVPAPGFADNTDVKVLIRPEGIRPVRQNNPAYEGHVSEVRFLGNSYEVQIVSHALDKPLLARASLRRAPVCGELARFSIDPDHVLVFAS